jgi:DNA modification methylase
MLEVNKTHLGDCLELMCKIPDQSIDMILCDLPYGTTNCKWDSVIPLNDFIVFHGINKSKPLSYEEWLIYSLKKEIDLKTANKTWN